MAVLFESWLTSKEEWKSSSLVMSMRQTKSWKRKGARKWLLKSELLVKYQGNEAIVDEIISGKLADEAVRKVCVRRHPDLVHAPEDTEDNMQYLVFDEAGEVEEDDLVMQSLFKCSDSGKGGSKKSKKRDRSESSSSGSDSDSDESSKDSSSSSSGKKKKGKKDKKGKKKSEKKMKKKKKQTGKKGKKLSKEEKEQKKAAEEEKKTAKEQKEKEKKEEKEKDEARKNAKKASQESCRKTHILKHVYSHIWDPRSRTCIATCTTYVCISHFVARTFGAIQALSEVMQAVHQSSKLEGKVNKM